MKHYNEKVLDLWHCFFEGTYSFERFRHPEFIERLFAYDRTNNCKADLERVVALVCPKSGLKILDFGCGIGTLCAKLAAQGCDVTGADVSPEILAVAKARYPEIPFLPIDDVAGEYDVVVSMHVLGHVPAPRETLSKMHDLLARGGRVVFCLPNPAFTVAMIPNNIVNSYLPDLTAIRCWSRRRVISELSSAGFGGIEIETFGELPTFFRFNALRSRLVGEASKC